VGNINRKKKSAKETEYMERKRWVKKVGCKMLRLRNGWNVPKRERASARNWRKFPEIPREFTPLERNGIQYLAAREK
jgi:hypothetical protein